MSHFSNAEHILKAFSSVSGEDQWPGGMQQHNNLEGVKMSILAWIFFGLVVGVIAKLIMPGKDGGGFFITCGLGIVGAVLGGWIATALHIGGNAAGMHNRPSFFVAVIGAIIVLAIFRFFRNRR